jgi:filamentous hemagglutinin family protein
MNHIYRTVWNAALGACVAVAENARGAGKSGSVRSRITVDEADGFSSTGFTLRPACRAALVLLAAAALVTPRAHAANAADAVVSSGTGSVATSGATTTITQGGQRLAIDWSKLSTAAGEALVFNQPNAQAIALNRIIGSSPSEFLGSLTANGQVFILNPNGVLFGAGSQVNVGGLVASTLSMSNADFESGNYKFSGSGGGSVVNQGTLTAANGGYIALLAPEVRNEGVMTASLGTALLAAGNKVTLNLDNGSLLGYSIDQGAINALAENKHLIKADGGQVLLSAKAMDALTAATVNNTGVVEAKTLQNKAGRIMLMGDMEHGMVKVGGTLDASAPNGGDGGFIETSAAHVKVASGTRVTTSAPNGQTGKWLIDPHDFTIAATGGDMTGAQVGAALLSTDFEIQSSQGANAAGSGDINVNDAVNWSANTLTLTAARDININAVMTASGTSALTMNASGVNVGLNPGGFTGRVDFPGRSGTGFLTINGNGYTVINSLGAQGSTSGADLQGMNGNLVGYYALGGNIDASSTSSWHGGAGFVPLGTNGNGVRLGDFEEGFLGQFNGLGHVISNLTINRPTAAYVGLFGSLGTDFTFAADVRNVGMTGNSVVGNNDVGGLAGFSLGATFSRNYAGGSITAAAGSAGGLIGSGSGTVFQSFATGVVNGISGVGGLIGGGSGTINQSWASATVNGNSSVGGLAGLTAGGLIVDSYATGAVSGTAVVGGLVGQNAANITRSYAVGAVTGGNQVGGLVGQHGPSGPVTISLSHATGAVSGQDELGGLVGNNRNGASVVDSYATGTVGGGANSSRIGGLIGYNMSGSVSRSYAAGSVSGTFKVGGLIGDNFDAVSQSYATGTVSGGDGVGGLIGSNKGATTQNYATGAVSGASQIGGLIGTNSIERSPYPGGPLLTGSVHTSYATGSVSGSSEIGGLVGTNYGSIVQSYAAGAVGGGSTFCAGALVGCNANFPGVGAGTISQSHWDTYSTGRGTAVGGAGQGASNLIAVTSDPSQWSAANYAYSAGAYTNFDVDAVGGQALTWRIYSGSSAPILKTFLTTANVASGGALGNASAIYSGTYQAGATGSPSYSVTLAGGGAANPALLLGTTRLTCADCVNVGTHTVTPGLHSGQQGYDLIGIPALSATLDITARPITVTADALGRTYGNANPVLSYSVGGLGLVNGDTLTGAQATTAGLTSNVGNYAITQGSLAASSNYAVTYLGDNLTVTPAPLTVSGISAANKVYDQTNAATVNVAGASYTGLIGGDVVTVSATGVFSDKHVANGKTVTLTSSYSGAQAGNYTITDQATTTADITQKALSVSGITADTRVYDQGTGATVNTTGAVYGGLIAGDVLAVNTTGAFTDKNVATGKTVNLVSSYTGADVGNYAIASQTTTTADITPKTLTVSGVTAGNKVYDQSTGAQVSTLSAVYGGLIAGDAVTVSTTGLFTDKNAATGKTVNLTSSYTGADVGNYAITSQTTTTADITPKALTVSGVTAASKVYDQTTAATVSTTGAVLGGLIAGDVLAVNTTGAFTDKNAANGKTVNLTSNYTGADVGNYTITDQATTTANIDKLAIVGSISGQDKVYDGNTTATIGFRNLTGVISGDVVTYTGGIASFGDKNAGIQKTMTATGLSLTGVDAGNYTVNSAATSTGDIDRATLTVTAAAQNKVYDATTVATLAYTDNRIAGDALLFSTNASFADKNVGTAKTVTYSGLTQTGADAGNYTLISATSGTSNADITPASLSVVANNDTRIAGGAGYSGGNGVSYSGLVAGETAAVLGGALTYGGSSQGANAAGSYAITPGGYSSSNYAISYLSGVLSLTSGGSAEAALGGTALVTAYGGALQAVGGMGASLGGTGGGGGAGASASAAAGDDAGALATAAAEAGNTGEDE